jgi:hypothetical protein
MRQASWTRLLVALATIAFLASLTGAALAGPKGKKASKGPKVSTVTGELTKMANKKGKLTGAQLKDAEGKVYQVVLDRQGVKLTKALAGKQAEVSAVMVVKGKGKAKKTWLRIKSFKEATPPPAEPEEGAEDEGADEEGDGDL